MMWENITPLDSRTGKIKVGQIYDQRWLWVETFREYKDFWFSSNFSPESRFFSGL